MERARPADVSVVVESLVAQHGEPHRARIEQGVQQVASLWREEDGDLAAFARDAFIADPAERQATLARLEMVLEQLDGHLNEMVRELRRPTDLDLGPLLPVDPMLAALDPGAHLTEDLFRSKVAFVALLNFPVRPLTELTEKGSALSREEWAAARLTGRFAQRIPPRVQQAIAEAGARADLYVSSYNIWMHHLLDGEPGRAFPRGLRLISHWNLRDELKAAYADPAGLRKQRLILQVMDRIVTQTIPAAVIDNPRVDWNPFTNTVTAAPPDTVEEGAPTRAVEVTGAREPDTRYARLLEQFHAYRQADPFVPTAPTALARSFVLQRELTEERVVALLEAVLTSPVVPKVAALMEERLGRPLGPQDLWFNGFRGGSRPPEAELDARVRKRYPDAEAYARDMPRMLRALGFSPEKARFLAEHIRVDPSRGAGHAMPALRRGDFPRLRTRVEKGGMDYKGYNIAVHEMGHNVEQVFSLYGVDHTLLSGVPGSAFTEALAFVFQARDLELLGLPAPDAAAERERVLNAFWQTWEIAGVALVDIAVWHWMYEHPDATPEQLREAVVRIAREHWNRFYAPVLGAKDSALLGIYSHMVYYPLYLANYPLGHLIAFQIEEQLERSGDLGGEFERMATFGNVVPDVWMQHATGAPVSAEPLLRATEAAVAGTGR
ncbi:MAG: hypothetical protein L0Y66_21800 [Myxococcaceae bacterium]|nr:hypothetical protein [Myxococcaceae bacterium]MCI0671581.1 hypothetical protein [Myxococcaceae bacterium]